MKADEPTGIPTKLNAKQLEQVSADLARVTLERIEQEQLARDESTARRKAIKDLKAEQTKLAKEKESGMRLMDRQVDFLDDEETEDQGDQVATPPPPAAAPETPAKKARKPRGK